MEFWRQLTGGITQAWGRLTLSARVQIVLAGLATASVIVVLVAFGSKTQYVNLFPDHQLSPAEVRDIQSALDGQDISYQLAQGGRAVQVPSRDFQQAKVLVSAEGIVQPLGSLPGFGGAATTSSLMSTPYQQQLAFQDAVMSRLQQNLNVFDFVNRSYVMIREAEQRLMTSMQQPSEATVTLDVNRQPSTMEIKAVLNVVSSYGGSFLDPEHITLATTEGKLLHSPAQDGFEYIANSKKELHLDWERAREEAVEKTFADLGVRCVAQVAMIIDQSTKTTTTKQMIEGVPVSEMTSERTLSTNESLPEGPAGAQVNLPEGTGGPRAVSTTESEEETIMNNEPSTLLVEESVGPGTPLKAQVTAILEAGTYQDEVDADGNPTGNRTYVPADTETITQYKSIVARAVGFGLSGDDVDVDVFDQPFKLAGLGPAPVQMAATTAVWDKVVQYGTRPFQAFLVILLFVVIRWLFLRTLISEDQMAAEEMVADLPEMTSEELRRRDIEAEVGRLSSEDPEIVASLLRAWLSESEE